MVQSKLGRDILVKLSELDIFLTPEYKISRHRVDFADIPGKIAIEIDGPSHDGTNDLWREDSAIRLGWVVRRYSFIETNSIGEYWDQVDDLARRIKYDLENPSGESSVSSKSIYKVYHSNIIPGKIKKSKIKRSKELKKVKHGIEKYDRKQNFSLFYGSTKHDDTMNLNKKTKIKKNNEVYTFRMDSTVNTVLTIVLYLLLLAFVRYLFS